VGIEQLSEGAGLGLVRSEQPRSGMNGLTAFGFVGLQASSRALRRIGKAGYGVAVGIQARCVECRIDYAEPEILCQKRLLIGDSRLYVVYAFRVGNIRTNPDIGERSMLSYRLLLRFGGPRSAKGFRLG
jgi:hypothetical protein